MDITRKKGVGFLGKANEFFAAPGGAVGSFVGDALHNASNFVCQLHYNTPGVIFDISPFNRELWKELCKDRPSGLPSSQPPFVGGQCPVVYRPYLYYEVANVGGAVFFSETKSTETVDGPVRGVAYRSNGGQTTLGIEFGASGSLGFRAYSIVNDSQHEFRNARIVRLERLDGQPDNCGDPPVPPVQPVVLPISQRTTNIQVTSVTNTKINVNVVADFPSAPIDFSVNVPLRLTIDNRKFYLDIDGWYAGEPSVPSGGDSPIQEDVTQIKDNVLKLEGTLNQYFAPINPSIDNTLVLVSPSGGKPSDEQKNVPGAAWLIIDLTKTPDKAQYGGDSPTVYFAGWIEFLKEGRAFPRQQINFEQSIFRFPDGADGYAYTFTNGAQGNVSVYVEEAQ